MEQFSVPCVGGIIERTINGEAHILLQTRHKENGGNTNGMLELPGGKIRAYEDIFTALRREVLEETGLHLTKIHGETACSAAEGYPLLSFSPYFTTQNLAGAYPIIVHFFRCEAEGEPLDSTEESRDIRWVSVSQVKALFSRHSERFFFLQHAVLRHYLGL